jgi:hypothetical protein
VNVRILLLFSAAAAAVIARPNPGRPAGRATDGERHVAGQLIVQLGQSLRGRVHTSVADGIVRFGIPALDDLSRNWRVSAVTPLLRDPSPPEALLRHGCDLMYLIQFDVLQDVKPVAADFARLPEVLSVCPNALLELDTVPRDSLYSGQWHLDSIDAPVGWGGVSGDTAVVIVVLDDGVDYRHPDLEANLRVNRAEDLNQNGRFDPEPAPEGDVDGIDQDNNGYADDVIGYDFVLSDPDPMCDPGDVHGTHCAGTANAVTDNGAGVAAPPWNIRTLATRCGFGGSVYLSAAISGIYYAVSEGAWAISMSFGGMSPYPALAQACLAAWDAGLVLFASAGGDGARAIRYPAGCEGVECVAATGRNMRRVSWTNWGPWIDVCAPGEDILATVPRASGFYGALDGTSIATPVAAAVASWIKCVHPEASNAEALQILHDCSEPVDDSLYRIGEFGAGIVNMGNVIARESCCDLRLARWRFNDASGNANGRPDPGETCAVVITYVNAPGFRDATGVRSAVACSSSGVVMLKDTASFPDIAAGDSADCSADSFVMFVPDSAPPQRVTLRFTATATPQPFRPASSFECILGAPRVLIVNDDCGSSYERFYTGACDSNHVLYDLYTVQTSGSPSCDTLRCYPVVIWFTGNDSTGTLDSADRSNLAAYLDSGGNLLLSGQNIAWDLAGDRFLEDYLHAQLADDSTGQAFVVGLPGEPIMDGDTAVLSGSGGAGNSTSADAVIPLNGASGCARYRDYGDSTVYAVIRYSGAYRLVFFSCAFEAIDHWPTRYVQKWTLLRRILAYFGERIPGMAHELPGPDIRPHALKVNPSPFTRQATVSFIAPISGRMEFRTFSTDGRLVASQAQTATMGQHVSFRLDAAALATGAYLVQILTPCGLYAQKATVLK